MLVAAGQPVEVRRTLRDVQGEPLTPTATPVAVGVAVLTAPGSGLPTGSVPCTVRDVDTGLYGAMVPASLLTEPCHVEVRWSWVYDGQTFTATDAVEVTPVAVCTLDDLAALPGEKAKSVSVAGRLRAVSYATRAFESATNQFFSPRIVQETRSLYDPFPAIPAMFDGSLFHAIQDQAACTVTYTYLTGMPSPPEDVTRAVAILASSVMVDGPWDDRGVKVYGDGMAERMLTAGMGRAMFSIPEVEATAKRYRVPVIA